MNKARFNAYFKQPAASEPSAPHSASDGHLKNRPGIETFLYRSHAGIHLRSPEYLKFSDRLQVHRSELLFLDVESIGLSRDAANIPYLIGLGHFTENGFRIIRLFSETPIRESSTLAELDSIWSRFSYIVTYNGKSFDIPLIKTRFDLYRRSDSACFKEHFDLYHLLRRISPGKPARLKDAEARILNFTRENDLPGSYSGQAYFEYTRYGDRLLLERIMRHNQLDILSLAALSLKVHTAAAAVSEKKTNWAARSYRLTDHRESPATVMALLEEKKGKDDYDWYYMGDAAKRLKDYPKAFSAYLRSYRKGCRKALPAAITVAGYYMKNPVLALRLTERYLPVEEADMQLKLLQSRQRWQKKITAVTARQKKQVD